MENSTQIFHLPSEQEKGPTFENLFHQEYFKDLTDSNPNQKPKDRSIFVIFLAVLPALEA